MKDLLFLFDVTKILSYYTWIQETSTCSYKRIISTISSSFVAWVWFIRFFKSHSVYLSSIISFIASAIYVRRSFQRRLPILSLILSISSIKTLRASLLLRYNFFSSRTLHSFCRHSGNFRIYIWFPYAIVSILRFCNVTKLTIKSIFFKELQKFTLFKLIFVFIVFLNRLLMHSFSLSLLLVIFFLMSLSLLLLLLLLLLSLLFSKIPKRAKLLLKNDCLDSWFFIRLLWNKFISCSPIIFVQRLDH